MFVNSSAFDVPILQTDFGDRAIGQALDPGLLLCATIIAVHNGTTKCKTLKKGRILSAVNEREYLLSIKDGEIDEILVDKQFVRRRDHLIAAIIPHEQ